MHANERNNCQHCWRLSNEAMHSNFVILRKNCNTRAQTFSRGQHFCGSIHSMQTGATNIVALRFEQWKCWDLFRQSLTGFKLYATSANTVAVVPCKRTQHFGPKQCCMLLANNVVTMCANGRNKSQHCCMLLTNNLASICMGLKV